MIVVLSTLSTNGITQTVYTLTGKDNDLYRPISIRNTPLFNGEEIKKRKIQACYITRHPVQTEPEILDTVFVFYFNQKGEIIKRISFDRYAGVTHDTLWKGPWDSRHSVKHLVQMENNGDKVKETICTVWKYQGDDFPADTASVITRIYDLNGRMLEEQENATRDYIDVWHCGTGIMPRIKYEYDRLGQVSKISIADWKTTARLEYKRNHIFFSVNRSNPDRVTKEKVYRLENSGEIKEVNSLGETVLTKLENGSKLFKKLKVDYGTGGEYYFHYSSKL